MTRVRFAPSPTGYLHLGNARAAILNNLFALSHKGEFLLRIDDTDNIRSTREYEESIYEDLHWLGIEYNKQYKQSQRNDVYNAAFEKLRIKGCIYPCYETKDHLDQMRKNQLASGFPPIYGRTALSLSDEEKNNYAKQGIKPHWRFFLNRRRIVFDDLIHGTINFDLNSVSDPIIKKEDGGFTYTFTSCVDDIDLNISHVIRGDDHVANTAVQLEILQALTEDLKIQFAHYPLMSFESNGKLSKRQGDMSLKFLKAQGIEPESIISLIAKIGTSDPVILHKDWHGLVSEFEITKISKSPPTIMMEDLWALNKKLFSTMDFKTAHTKFGVLNEKFWNLIHENIFSRSDIDSWVCALDEYRIVVDEEYLKFINICNQILLDICIGQDKWEDVFIEKLKTTSGKIYSSKEIYTKLRIILTGKEKGPHVIDILNYLGIEKVREKLSFK